MLSTIFSISFYVASFVTSVKGDETSVASDKIIESHTPIDGLLLERTVYEGFFNPEAIKWPVNTTNDIYDVMQQKEQFDKHSHSYNNRRKLSRGKRYLDFQKGTRMSLRTVVKNNMLQVNTLWAYGFGIRANYPFPDKKDRLRPFFKRDVLHGLVDVLDGHGLDGHACILKSYCTALLDLNSNLAGGMLYKLLRLIFLGTDVSASHHDGEKKDDVTTWQHFPYLRRENCHQILHSHCPLSFNNISPYTDDI